ncbi:FAD-binding oxidoreductase [Mesorhizobium intechi]|uniref:FAD-binding oxidoreductase n=1 Tax=Mesorhizobium intechi TaxID=537601 RepID=UPI000CC87989|nr:FAD-binding oxidoreductase [Mesorhizobium intechi]TSE13404.1 FAD-binding oxidoreductase [Mesorhizobium intechi]
MSSFGINRRHLKRIYPANPADIAPSLISRRMGHRPSIPDGRPVIARSNNCDKIIRAFGHGHIGVASAPKTTEFVSSLIADDESQPAAFAAGDSDTAEI